MAAAARRSQREEEPGKAQQLAALLGAQLDRLTGSSLLALAAGVGAPSTRWPQAPAR